MSGAQLQCMAIGYMLCVQLEQGNINTRKAFPYKQLLSCCLSQTELIWCRPDKCQQYRQIAKLHNFVRLWLVFFALVSNVALQRLEW